MLCQLCGGDTRLAKITVCCRGNPRDKRLEIVEDSVNALSETLLDNDLNEKCTVICMDCDYTALTTRMHEYLKETIQ